MTFACLIMDGMTSFEVIYIYIKFFTFLLRKSYVAIDIFIIS